MEDNQEAPKKKPLYKNWWVIIGGTVSLLIVVGSVSDSQESAIQTAQQAQQEVIENTYNTPTIEEEFKTKPTTQVENKTVVNEPVTSPPTEYIPITTSVSGRDEIIAILKTNAEKEWGTNYEMVRYELDNQIASYDWVVQQNQYPTLMANAKNEWGHNYEMVKYEYENQSDAYKWVLQQTAYPNIMSAAKQEWGTNYEMVKYEYENQVEAYQSL